MHIVYFYIRLYSFYGPCGPDIKLYYYYYFYNERVVEMTPECDWTSRELG